MDDADYRLRQFRDVFELMQLEGTVSFHRDETVWGDGCCHIFYEPDDSEKPPTLVVTIYEEN